MPILYKIDVLEALKEKGYNTTKLRTEKIIGESYLTQIRKGEIVSNACLEKLCKLLNMQPGDILEFVEEEK